MTTEEYLRRLVADWPPFTPEQRDHIRALMRPQQSRRETPAARTAA
ncbi:hypothetical protein ACIOC2_19025 [Streptomyces sp. NPDC088337]|nr:hypothetical protein [Streptomyces sp. NBC_01788]WSB29655.1 hypothetical protein OIE49_29325 [Streptomyces sp. NBC_01788]